MSVVNSIISVYNNGHVWLDKSTHEKRTVFKTG